MKNKIQKRFDNLDEATEYATTLAQTENYVAVIRSIVDMDTNPQVAYYVENDSPFIRNWENLECEFENGKIVVA